MHHEVSGSNKKCFFIIYQYKINLHSLIPGLFLGSMNSAFSTLLKVLFDRYVNPNPNITLALRPSPYNAP